MKPELMLIIPLEKAWSESARESSLAARRGGDTPKSGGGKKMQAQAESDRQAAGGDSGGLHGSSPGSLNVPAGMDAVEVGISGHPAFAKDSKGDLYEAEAHVVDGYDEAVQGGWNGLWTKGEKVATAGGKGWDPKAVEDLYNSPEVRKKLGVPDGFKFYTRGMNDSDEAGYAIYTNGKWKKSSRDTSSGNIDGPWGYPDRDQ